MSSRLLVVAIVALVGLALTGVGFAIRGGASQPGSEVLVLEEPEVPVETLTASPSETGEPTAPPSPSSTKSSPHAIAKKPRARTFRYDAAYVQRRLTELKYYVGPINGRVTAVTRSAVMAFQKVNGLRVDGVVGPATLAQLDHPVLPTARAATPSVHIEVDLTRQVLIYVQHGTVERILPVSSGNGATYRQKDGDAARALTPIGWYRIQRKIRGLREADLGSLYDPMYFYKGWALHGSNSVPAYPASHGCVRLTRWDALWLFDRAPVGIGVYLYGGRHTFPAGSSAPGTDNPTGDTSEDTASPSPGPTASPSSQSPSSSPSSSSPSPSQSTSPSPSQSTQSTSPSPSQSTSPSSSFDHLLPPREEATCTRARCQKGADASPH